MSDIKEYKMSKDEVEKKYGGPNSKTTTTKSFEEFLKEREIYPNQNDSVKKYGSVLAHRLRYDSDQELAFAELALLKSYADQHQAFVNRVLSVVNYYLRTYDEKEAVAYKDKEMDAQAEQALMDRLYDPYEGEFIQDIQEFENLDQYTSKMKK